MLSTTSDINSQRNIVIKEDRSFWIADSAGQGSSHEHGFYAGDTRLVTDCRWEFADAVSLLQTHSPRLDNVRFHYAHIGGPDQLLSFRREVTVSAGRLSETLIVQNHDEGERTVRMRFFCGPDFTDIFIVRGLPNVLGGSIHTRTIDDRTLHASYRSERFRGEVTVYGSVEEATGRDSRVNVATPEVDGRTVFQLSFITTLAAGERGSFFLTLEGWAEETHGNEHAGRLSDLEVDGTTLPSYEEWESSFPAEWFESTPPEHRRALETAIRDLRGLLITTPDGPFPTAGIPWYVAVFGRDALITAYFMLRWRPDVALSVLRHLARYQGDTQRKETEEAPGKILHELRGGELAARKLIPHRPYYGTVDATALFVVLCGALAHDSRHQSAVTSLRPAWEAALRWITDYGDADGDLFVEYDSEPAGPGTIVTQSWKDSHDSMSHADGIVAAGKIAGAEVQGYSYAAFLAAARLYRTLGEERAARLWTHRARELREAFDGAFWLETMGTYAMALDGEKRPLAVRSSNAGQLLWTGIVPEARAPQLVRTLFSPDLWTGWGIRTLGAGERRYNPLSYHNGSVWPHDTAIIALGLRGYGFTREAEMIRSALFDLARGESDQRLPELVAGYTRTEGPPTPYPVACRPQAWDAAALVALSGLEGSGLPVENR